MAEGCGAGSWGARVTEERRVGARRAGGRTARDRRAGARGVGCARQGNRGPCVVGGGDLLSAMGLVRGGSWGVVESRGLAKWWPSRSPPHGDVGSVGVQNAMTWWVRRAVGVAHCGEAGAMPCSGAGVTCVQQSCESFDTKSVG